VFGLCDIDKAFTGPFPKPFFQIGFEKRQTYPFGSEMPQHNNRQSEALRFSKAMVSRLASD
jgi:hypothetical protein